MVEKAEQILRRYLRTVFEESSRREALQTGEISKMLEAFRARPAAEVAASANVVIGAPRWQPELIDFAFLIVDACLEIKAFVVSRAVLKTAYLSLRSDRQLQQRVTMKGKSLRTKLRLSQKTNDHNSIPIEMWDEFYRHADDTISGPRADDGLTIQ